MWATMHGLVLSDTGCFRTVKKRTGYGACLDRNLPYGEDRIRSSSGPESSEQDAKQLWTTYRLVCRIPDVLEPWLDTVPDLYVCGHSRGVGYQQIPYTNILGL